ncbi:MAG: hypothetical protein EOO38_02220 [Cytophagaceae bacterium]|nr:MAG: hypothetical protein EOO38_02220 [Cytophagaceae bacterium]
MTFAPPVDYAQVRKHLVRALCAMTGLGPNQVIRYQGQGPVQPRPKLPYITFKYTRSSIRSGYDAIVPAFDDGDTLWRYVGERGINMDLVVYGRDQDEAYGLGLAIQSGLQQEPVAEILGDAGLSIWSLGDVTDMTELLGTGFEGRALLQCEMWVGTSQLVDLGQMKTVTVVGDVRDDTGNPTHLSVTATLSD